MRTVKTVPPIGTIVYTIDNTNTVQKVLVTEDNQYTIFKALDILYFDRSKKVPNKAL